MRFTPVVVVELGEPRGQSVSGAYVYIMHRDMSTKMTAKGAANGKLGLDGMS